MTCQYFSSLLDDFVDRELASPIKDSVRAHVSVCSACRADLDELVRLRELLAGVSSPEPEPGYWQEAATMILARTTEARNIVDITSEVAGRSRERSAFYRSLIAVAASLLVFFGSLVVGSLDAVRQTERRAATAETKTVTLAASNRTPSGGGYITFDEQNLIAGSIILVGTPGMFASSSSMAIALGVDQGR
jgi:predicted anti-sigma-YlaC factor YlaD